MEPAIHILAPFRSPRLEWVVEVSCRHILGVEGHLHTDADAWQQREGLRLAYGRPHPAAHLHIPEHGFLRESGIRACTPPAGRWGELPVPFAGRGELPFDLFAASFFLLSRYEEYLPFEADGYGRFPASASWLARHECLHLPLVDLWMARLRELARRALPRFDWPAPRRRWIPTCDVDMAWAFLHRPWWRTLGGLLRDLMRGDIHVVGARLRTLRGRQPDPFDTFDRMCAHYEAAGTEPVFFFHVGPWGRYDKNVPVDHPAMQALIRRLAAKARIGLHPSFARGQTAQGIIGEKRALERVLGREVTDSRHHFLRIRLPHTCRALIEAGIRCDWSMGFADRPGFRAGTAHAFPWYDLERETPTSLVLVPLVAMEVSMLQYLGLEPRAARELLQSLWDAMQPGGGLFVTLWHNSTPFDTAPWWGWSGEE